MACTATNAEAQCPGGCFGYPTPAQSTFRSYAPVIQYQPVQVVPVEQTFASQPVFVEQTFTSQPVFVESGVTNVPQNFSQPAYPSLPVGAYNVRILPGTEPMHVNPVDGTEENVQEGQIEGEIISPADGSSGAPSVLQQDNANDDPPTAARSSAVEREAEKAAMEKAQMERKAAMQRAAQRKAAEEKSGKKVITKQERIANLETSLKRQIKRAQQANQRDLRRKLKELKAGDATDATIETAKRESAAALKEKIAEIEKRVQARIDQLKN